MKLVATPSTVGEHIFKKRLEGGVTRKELASGLRVDEFTVMNRELGRTKAIPARLMPAIVTYLGYNPEPKPEEIGGQLRRKRRSLGWTTREAATRNSVDQSTWEAWEKTAGWPAYARYRRLLEEFLALPPEELVGQVRQVRPAAARRGSPARGVV